MCLETKTQLTCLHLIINKKRQTNEVHVSVLLGHHLAINQKLMTVREERDMQLIGNNLMQRYKYICD
jgi:hypothetical protein